MRIGAVLEATDFHPGRSGRDHLRTLAQAVKLPDTRVDEVLRLVELQAAARRRVKGYSLGMRQRLGLAAALLGDPELLVLDEPANGLDPEGVRWLRDFLRAFALQGRTVLISSHQLAEVAQTVDQVLIISRGRLVVESSLEQLTARLIPRFQYQRGQATVFVPLDANPRALGRVAPVLVPAAELAITVHHGPQNRHRRHLRCAWTLRDRARVGGRRPRPRVLPGRRPLHGRLGPVAHGDRLADIPD